MGPLMRSTGRRKIINCAGGGGTFPFPQYSAYATSKAAIVRFTENLAVELTEDEIDVNCIAPGFVVTRLHEQTMAAGAEKAGAFFGQTQKQMASGGVPAERSAELATFLLSGDSDGISGKYISAPWDAWRDAAFQARLRSDKDFGTLRRIDDQQFARKADG
jgi:3-oxoacyl-[acyl-carrier protein] reductase